MLNSFKDTILTTQSSTAISVASRENIATTRPEAKHPRIGQNFVLILLDQGIDELNDNCQITQLRNIVNSINIFNNTDQCVDFLTDIKHETVFMILSCVLCEHALPLIHNLFQLDSIYVFCEDKKSHEICVKQWSKVKGIFTQISEIYELLKKAARQCDWNSVPISIVPNSDITHQTLNELDQSFMYTQLLKEILFKIDYDEQSIRDLAAYCRDGNSGALGAIDQFEKEYHTHSPIWWYTSPFFICHMLNRALRIQEIDTIIKMGFLFVIFIETSNNCTQISCVTIS